ncbi:lipoprotein [Mizugakiibacter sediminis]|uniref:Lipoprotein n=1 Tax=Mizugakiibacter sediminis TaxID=1475481 RepID=A0A0K8QJC3_9GAMM|nr:hypothetical protein [Mizugakiibacter sediminis]GAP65035.1 lipoprotein [Mizugakiibacter sediminis]
MPTHRSSLLLAAALGVALSGCGRAAPDGAVATGDAYIAIRDGLAIVRARGLPDASIAADGALRIGETAIATTPAQREQLARFHAEAVALRDDGIATGRAGLAVAGHAIGAVISGLAGGDPDRIDKDVDARARIVEARARKLCADLAQLRTTQDAIASALPAFRPYARISADDADRCKR